MAWEFAESSSQNHRGTWNAESKRQCKELSSWAPASNHRNPRVQGLRSKCGHATHAPRPEPALPCLSAITLPPPTPPPPLSLLGCFLLSLLSSSWPPNSEPPRAQSLDLLSTQFSFFSWSHPRCKDHPHADDSALNPRLIYPPACSAALFGCLTVISNLTCPKQNSWSSDQNPYLLPSYSAQ